MIEVEEVQDTSPSFSVSQVSPMANFKVSDYLYVIKSVQALVHAGFCSAGEISKLVSEMHATIVNTTIPFAQIDDKTPLHKQAPLPYRWVTGGLIYVSKLLKNVSHDELDSNNPSWMRFRAAFNGVAGDKLAYWQNALAMPMEFINGDGETLSIEQINRHQSDGIVIFLHGLACSDHDWKTDEHHKLVESLKQQNKQVIWLRYNSGLHIHQNGERLAEMLQFIDFEDKDLTLIGHSMGGLLMRSAYIIAQTHKYKWLNKLSRAVYIGSPHHGSQFERSGNYANALVGMIPYLRPFMRLGNIRSNAIKDLRFGYIIKENSAKGIHSHDDARRGTPSLPSYHEEGTHHLFIASSLNSTTRNNFIGDGLVPVKSALGEHQTKRRLTIKAEHLKKIHISDVSHMGHFSDSRVYDAIKVFLD